MNDGTKHWPAAWAAGGVLALFFMLLELMKTFRSSQWSGLGWPEVPDALLGYGIYAAALIAGIALCRAFTRRMLPEFLALPAAAFMAAGILWALLSRYREYAPTLDDAVILTGLLVFSGGMALYTGLLRRRELAYCLMAALILLAGLAALVASGNYLLFNPGRARLVVLWPAAWLLVSSATAIPLWMIWRGYLARGLHAALAILLPIIAYHALLYRPARAEEDTRPNLLFVVSDSLRADYLRLYGGNIETPHIEELAQRGVVFDRAYSLGPWTMPSMSAMFSSDYPPGLTPGVPGEVWLTQIWQYAVTARGESLAQRLREQGYATAAITANALLWDMPGLMDGFDVQARAHPILLDREGWLRHCPFLHDTLAAHFPRLDGTRPHNADADMVNYAQAFMRRHHGQPFFLWVHFIDPHAPYDPPAKFRTETGPWPFFYPYAGGERWGIPLLSPDFDVEQEHRAYVRSLYEGEIRQMDSQLGRLLRQVDAIGARSRSIVCFTSDHGEELWDHGDWGHGHTVYEEQIRVPLLFAGPGIAARRIPAAMSAIDLMPTLAALMGLPPAPHWRGQSFAQSLRESGIPLDERPIFAQGTSNRCAPEPLRAAIAGPNKIIQQTGSGIAELYHLPADPAEQNDLAEKHPETLAQLRALIEEWARAFQSTFDAPHQDNGIDPAHLETLRGMGYL